jgi:hypothetical protein
MWVASMTLLSNAIAMLALCGAMLALRALKRDSGWLPSIAAVTLFALFAVIISRSEWSATMGAVQLVIANLSGVDNGASGLQEPGGQAIALQILASPIAGRFLIGGLSLLAPFLTIVVFGVLGLTHRKEAPSRMVTGVCGAGTMIGLVLVLLYVAAVHFTAAEENRQSREMDRQMRHEGRYYAELAGRKWPEAVPDVR